MTTPWRTGVLRREPGATPESAGWVVKVGGSLFVRPFWPADLRDLLRHASGPLTLVVGGGAVVDGLRTIDAASPRPAAVMHGLAIAAMGVTARLVADAVGLPVVPAPTSTTAVLDVPAWLSASPAAGLPAGWHVTSDSIAAVVAASSGGRLLLAKSSPPPRGDGDLAALAAAGWIDGHFPVVAARLTEIRWATPG